MAVLEPILAKIYLKSYKIVTEGERRNWVKTQTAAGRFSRPSPRPILKLSGFSSAASAGTAATNSNDNRAQKNLMVINNSGKNRIRLTHHAAMEYEPVRVQAAHRFLEFLEVGLGTVNLDSDQVGNFQGLPE